MRLDLCFQFLEQSSYQAILCWQNPKKCLPDVKVVATQHAREYAMESVNIHARVHVKIHVRDVSTPAIIPARTLVECQTVVNYTQIKCHILVLWRQLLYK